MPQLSPGGKRGDFMKRRAATFLLLVGISLPGYALQATEAPFESACKIAISSAVSDWELSPPTADMVQNGWTTETSIVRADFDDDGSQDVAFLIVSKAAADLPSDGGKRLTHPNQYIAVCLNKKGKPQLHLIRGLYCGDGIMVSRKGAKYHDYDTDDVENKYPTDGIHAYYFEKAGATYLLQGGQFRAVVDSD
jgi:hypothetical protein